MAEIIALAKKPLEVRAKSATKAEITIYAAIGIDFWGDGSFISAKNISDELNKLGPSINEITVRINSPGGDVFDGITIYNRLKQHKAKIIVYIDGLAASMASVIALAGDEIHMSEGALYMIHLPWTRATGNRDTMEKAISLLTDIEDQMVGIYAKRSGLTRNEIKVMMENETWMDAEETVKNGFADSKVEQAQPIAASVVELPWMKGMPKNFTSDKDAAKQSLAKFQAQISAALKTK